MNFLHKAKKIKLVKNTLSLYIMTIAKMLFPLITLPYLTRVLSVESYGINTYVNSIMSYVQLMIDFGFILSSTAKIAEAGEDKAKIGKITGNTIIAKLILTVISFAMLLFMIGSIDLLKKNLWFTLLSFSCTVLSIFLLDFLFQGIGQMHVLSIRFVVMRSISTVLTFALVKDDSDLIFIPILNIIAYSAAVFMSLYEVTVRFHIRIIWGKGREIIETIKHSVIYWMSDISTTAFTALNTVIIGSCINSVEVAYWGLAIQIIGTIQSFYSPITTSLYPEMIKEPRISLLKKIIIIFAPLVTGGCFLLYFLSGTFLYILGGSKYLEAVPVLHALIPLLFISFFSMLFGWPVLGAIQKAKETTFSTIAAATLQVIGLGILFYIGRLSIVNIAWLRFVTEFTMLAIRLVFCMKYKKLFKE